MVAVAPSFLMLILMGSFSASALPLGLPPGERDAQLLYAPADGCVFYTEWAEMSAGKPGAPGIDGLVADPEIKAFLEDAERAILTAIREEGLNAQETEAMQQVPGLVKSLVSRPGCFFISAGDDPLPARIDYPNYDVVMTRVKAGLVISAGDDAAEIEQSLLALLRISGIEPPESLDRFVLPVPVPGVVITLHREGDYIALVYGMGTLDTVIAGLNGDRPSLMDSERIGGALKRLKSNRTGRVCWIDLARIREIADATAGGDIRVNESSEILGLDVLDYFVSVTGVDQQGRVTNQCHLQTDGSTEKLLSLLGGRGLKTADLAHIPKDADLAVAKSVDFEKALEAVRSILQNVDQQSADELERSLGELDRELGFSIEKDVLPAYGQVWTLYDAPSHGGTIASSPILTLEVRDAQKAYEVFSNFMALLKRELPGEMGRDYRFRGVYLAERKFLDRTIYYINTVGDDDVPVAPSFCLTDKHLVFALHPQPIKSHLRFRESDSESLTASLSGRRSLDDRNVIYFARVNTSKAAQLIYGFVPYIGQVAMSSIQGDGGKIDVFSIPSASAILPYVGGTNATIERTENGITSRSTSGIPIPGLSGVTALLPAAFLGTVRAVEPARIDRGGPAKIKLAP